MWKDFRLRLKNNSFKVTFSFIAIQSTGTTSTFYIRTLIIRKQKSNFISDPTQCIFYVTDFVF